MSRDKTESHKRIMEAAGAEFLQYGYEDASLRRIAAKAGLQVGALYRHFPGKAEMFECLVEPAIQAFHDLYGRIEGEYFDESAAAGNRYQWETKSEVVRSMELIYDHLDEFRLLILKSRGTRFEDFKHEIAKMEEDITMRFLDVLREKGVHVRNVDRLEFHLLMTAYIDAFFQPLIHGLDRQDAMHYASTLEEFFQPAWKQWLQI